MLWFLFGLTESNNDAKMVQGLRRYISWDFLNPSDIHPRTQHSVHESYNLGVLQLKTSPAELGVFASLGASRIQIIRILGAQNP